MQHFYFASSIAMAAALAAGSASAAEEERARGGVPTVEEIVVTAQRREESLQKVPVTVTAYSATQLQQANIQTIQDLTTLTSGFVGPGVNGVGSPHIRGVGSQVSQPGIENSIATYVDGIYIGAVTPALLDLNAVRQIEVLKGPQGTLFGRNTTGGLIQIYTRDPSPQFEAEGSVGYANYDTASAWLYFNAPLSSQVATNLSVQGFGQGQGWGKNLGTGNDVYKVDQSLSIRNKWNFDLTDTTSIQVVADHEQRENVGFVALRPLTGTVGVGGYVSTATGWDVNVAEDSTDITEATGASVRLTQDLGFATLTSTSAYRLTRYSQMGQDGDKSPLPILTFDRITSDKQWTEELQLASNGDQPLTWVAGFFYFNSANYTRNPVRFPLGFRLAPPPVPLVSGKLLENRIQSTSYAAYAQASYRFASGTTLIAGYRYSDDEHSIEGSDNLKFVGGGGMPVPGSPVNRSVSRDAASWRLAISQDLSKDVMVFASYNRGTKPGAYNPTYLFNAPYNDETLDAYELGAKMTLLDGQMRLNISGFHYKYNDIQVNAFSPSAAYIYNGGAATMSGVDVDIEYRPVSNLTLRSSFEFMSSEFGDFPGAVTFSANPNRLPPFGGGFVQGVANAKGNSLPHAADFSGSLSASYRIPTALGDWDMSVTSAYNSGYWVDPTHTAGLKQPSYNIVGLSAQYTTSDEKRYARLWASNVTEAEVYNLLGVSTLNTFAGLNAPRTFGFTLGMKLN